MATHNCGSCEDLRQTSPEFILNGITDNVCDSLTHNTGLEPSAGHDDCEDLNLMNDCLIDTMATEVNSYETCDWKKFMKAFIPNVWTMFKGVICSICGLWCSITKLVDYLADSLGGQAFVRYFRNSGTGSDVPYYKNLTDHFEDTFDIYMDSDQADPGTLVADRDYVVMISNCTNFLGFRKLEGYVSFWSSGEDDSTAAKRAELRKLRAQHPNIWLNDNSNSIINFSWTTSGAVLLKKGEHIRVNFYVNGVVKGNASGDDDPRARLHQFILTWIPVNVSEALDPSDILGC